GQERAVRRAHLRANRRSAVRAVHRCARRPVPGRQSRAAESHRGAARVTMSAGVLVLFESGADGVTALHQAAELAAERQAELTVVTVAPQDTSVRSCGPGRSLYNQHIRELAEHDLQDAREALAQLAGQAIFTTLVQGRD